MSRLVEDGELRVNGPFEVGDRVQFTGPDGRTTLTGEVVRVRGEEHQIMVAGKRYEARTYSADYIRLAPPEPGDDTRMTIGRLTLARMRAARDVKAWMDAEGAEGRLRRNDQAPCWPTYAHHQRHLDEFLAGLPYDYLAGLT